MILKKLLMKNKLALGTVQFGLDYGINNKNGKLNNNEIFKILKYCLKKNITTIDTAQAYGSSEEKLGKNLSEIKFKVDIISKLSNKNIDCILKSFNESLAKLRVSKIFGFIYHDYNSFKNNLSSYDLIYKLKSQNKIKKIGFSLYHTTELEELLKNNIKFDLIQIPYNVFDRRFEPYFNELKKNNIEIHVRSVFLQGLFFSSIDKLGSHFDCVKEKLLIINNISRETNITTASLCLNFVKKNNNIDKIIVGVDSLENLKENYKSINENINRNILEKLNDLKENNEEILLPYKWIK